MSVWPTIAASGITGATAVIGFWFGDRGSKRQSEVTVTQIQSENERVVQQITAENVRPRPRLTHCGMQDRLGRLGAAAERRPSRGGTTWVALLRQTATHRLPRSVLLLSDRIHQAKGRIDPAISPGRHSRGLERSAPGMFVPRAGPNVLGGD
jgi:hypothetical protein